MTSLGIPLTTIYTAPSSCFSTIYNESQYKVGFTLVLGPPGLRDCQPPQNEAGASIFAFSPGFHCPKSYTTVFSTYTTQGTTTETRAACCPVLDGIFALSRYTFNYNPYSTESVDGCVLSIDSPVILPVVGFLTGTPIKTLTSGDRINAPTVGIAWQASDLVAMSTTTPIYPQTRTQLIGPTSVPSQTLTASASQRFTNRKHAIGMIVMVMTVAITLSL